MWAVFVDDILICFCASEAEAYDVAFRQPIDCDVAIWFVGD